MVKKYEKIEEIKEKPVKLVEPDKVIAGQYEEFPELPEGQKALDGRGAT